MRLCHTAINHQWGFGSKALQRFKLLPSHNSSILFDSITCHLTRQRTHYGGLFLMQTYTYVYACTHITCVPANTHTHTHTHKRRRTYWCTLRYDTIVLMVARRCCNLWRDRVAGLAPHQCLPTRWWAFSWQGFSPSPLTSGDIQHNTRLREETSALAECLEYKQEREIL